VSLLSGVLKILPKHCEKDRCPSFQKYIQAQQDCLGNVTEMFLFQIEGLKQYKRSGFVDNDWKNKL